ncbi:hypothetical protein HanRHA438_Chr00c28g0854491 [Helianthus annuus]|nr:hypothetical protein HanRHA438_Chr00c28g0854491 [Helianthus annuus]
MNVCFNQNYALEACTLYLVLEWCDAYMYLMICIVMIRRRICAKCESYEPISKGCVRIMLYS